MVVWEIAHSLFPIHVFHMKQSSTTMSLGKTIVLPNDMLVIILLTDVHVTPNAGYGGREGVGIVLTSWVL